MSTGAGGLGEVGRGKHLGQIAKVFRGRHGTWSDFGRFLKSIFGEELDIGRQPAERRTRPLENIVCRHNEGGRHFRFLAANQATPGTTLAAHERYSRPCVYTGSFDKKKNPGLVVFDLCAKANRFLLSIGKGDPNDSAGRDREYDNELNPPSSPLTTASLVTDSFTSIRSVNVLDTSGPRDPKRVRLNEVEGESSTDPATQDAEYIEDSDVEQALSSIAEEVQDDVADETVAEDSSLSESSLVEEGQPRQSTKMRAATLAYLCNFADEPTKLRDEFRRLRENPDLYVLHLCGCGICGMDGRTRVFGCCERTHLKLGSAVENSQHRIYHDMMRLAVNEDYATLVDIVHRAPHGDGLF